METIDVVFHYGGKWVYNPDLSYVDGEEDIIDRFDIDYLSYPHILKKYNVHLRYPNVKRIFSLKLRKSLYDGLFLLHDDKSILKMVKHIRRNMGCQELHIYAEHEVDIPRSNMDCNLFEFRDGLERNSEGRYTIVDQNVNCSNVNEDGGCFTQAPIQCSNVDSNYIVGSVGASTKITFSRWYKSLFLDENDSHMSQVFGDARVDPVGDKHTEVGDINEELFY